MTGRLKNTFSKGHRVLASCQVSSNSVQRLQRISRKCIGRSDARVAIIVERSVRKTRLRTVSACFLSNFIEFRSAVAKECRKCISKSEARVTIFVDKSFLEDVGCLPPVKFRKKFKL